MALYMAVSHLRSDLDPKANRANYQEIVECFLKWSPPEGMSVVHGVVSADIKTTYFLVEAVSHDVVSQAVAVFYPYADYEIVPVMNPEDAIRAVAASGLITVPNS